MTETIKIIVVSRNTPIILPSRRKENEKKLHVSVALIIALEGEFRVSQVWINVTINVASYAEITCIVDVV